MKNILNLSLKIAPSFLIVSAVSFALVLWHTNAKAEEAPSKTVLRIQQHIAENQDIITETRDAHIQFMTAKDDNTYQVRKLRELCYDLDWSTLKISKLDNCTPEDLE